MNYSELISYEKKYCKCKNDLLIIIPCFINYDILVKHLGYLSKQTFQKFDVVIVLGPNFDDAKLFNFLEKNNFGFGTIVIKRKEDTGSAGGFFAGQKYGMENNYQYMINADDDCMPVDPNIIESLYSKKELGYVCSTQKLVIESNYKTVSNPPCIAQYTLFSASMFKKYGFFYAPLYCGAEDSEFLQRIANEKFHIVSNIVEHPYTIAGKFVLKNPSRQWLYILSNMIMLKLNMSMLNLFFLFSLLTALSLLFITMYGFGLFISLNTLLFSFTLGKKAYNKLNLSIKQTILTKDQIPVNLETINDRDTRYLEGDAKAKLFRIFRESFPYFRKDVVILNTFSYLKIIMLGSFCRTLYFKMDDGSYMLISKNSSIIPHIAKLFVVPVFAVFYFILIILLFVPLKLLKQPRTMGYGLN